MLTRDSTEPADPQGGPITGGQVVPSHWRNTPQSGPIQLAGDIPALSTYLGHRDPRSTYWYLSAAPELLALAAGKLAPFTAPDPDDGDTQGVRS